MSFKKLLSKEDKQSLKRTRAKHYSNRLDYNDLISVEAELGRTVFGPIPNGTQREFFKDRDNIWIWYEKYRDNLGHIQEFTIRYDVRPSGVFKKTIGGKFEKIEGQELDNFCQATRNYLALVKSKLYC